jgi:hypothetical protein
MYLRIHGVTVSQSQAAFADLQESDPVRGTVGEYLRTLAAVTVETARDPKLLPVFLRIAAMVPATVARLQQQQNSHDLRANLEICSCCPKPTALRQWCRLVLMLAACLLIPTQMGGDA